MKVIIIEADSVLRLMIVVAETCLLCRDIKTYSYCCCHSVEASAVNEPSRAVYLNNVGEKHKLLESGKLEYAAMMPV